MAKSVQESCDDSVKENDEQIKYLKKLSNDVELYGKVLEVLLEKCHESNQLPEVSKSDDNKELRSSALLTKRVSPEGNVDLPGIMESCLREVFVLERGVCLRERCL